MPSPSPATSPPPLRTYLDPSDLAHWLLTLLEHGRPGQAYNVGSDEVISIADLAHMVRDLLVPEKPVHILGKPDPLCLPQPLLARYP